MVASPNLCPTVTRIWFLTPAPYSLQLYLRSVLSTDSEWSFFTDNLIKEWQSIYKDIKSIENIYVTLVFKSHWESFTLNIVCLGNPPGSTVWANFPIFILSNIRASHRCNKSWKMIRINRSIFPIFATSMTNTSVRQDESGKRNHKRWIKWRFILWQQEIYQKIHPAFLRRES